MKKLISLLCVLALLLTGCSATAAPAGTQSATAPAMQTEPAQAETEPVQPDLTRMQTDLATLTQNRRPIGSEGEANAVSFIKGRFEAMGYQVVLQEYTSESKGTGHNVIAVRPAEANSDILVISAHHDSVPPAFGANDDGSGVVAVLAMAEALASGETDTELRFITFTDEESGKNGSRHYVESLSEEERSRIVGCIQIDMLGGLGSHGMMLNTTDGAANWLTDLLMGQNTGLTLGTESASDHASFQLAGIPSVLVSQIGLGYLYHTAGDTADQVDIQSVYDAAATLVEAVRAIASPETASYQEIAHEQGGSYVYHQARSSRIFYGMSRQENEAYLGLAGELTEQHEETGDGWTDTYEVYTYQMGWFDSDKPMATHYNYRNGYLDEVKIYPAEAGYTVDQLVQMITDTHGEPTNVDEGAKTWSWEDDLYSKFIDLQEVDGKPEIGVYSLSPGMDNILATYDVTDGEATIDNEQHAKVWELLCSAIPKEDRQKIGQFRLFTDGYSGVLAYSATLGTMDDPDNTHFSMTIDYYDAYDENGAPRDQTKLMYTLIHEYGHILLENDTQIDVSVEPNIHDPAGFIAGSFRQRFYEQFWQDPYTSYLGSYADKPENYVREYAGNMFHEDIADTFAVFVFASKPTGDSVAEQKLLFFWADPGMVALREDIRRGLGID